MDYPDLQALRAGVELPSALAALDDPILQDIPWVRSNHATSHAITMRLPHRHLGAVTNNTFPQVTFGLSRPVDQAALIREMFYGSTWDNRQEATGLAEYFSTSDRGRAQNATNVINAGQRDTIWNASLYLVCWSPHTVYMAWNTDSEGKLLAAIVPEDWRYVVRVANVDTERRDLDVAAIMSHAAMLVPGMGVKPTFYMGSDVAEMFRDQQGVTATMFRNIPVRFVDALHSKEKRVS